MADRIIPEGSALIPVGKNGDMAIVDADMYDELSQYKWQLCQGYARRMWNDNGKTRSCLMHQAVLPVDPSLDTDHINRNRLDNRRCNLRAVTRAENLWNMAPAGKIRYKGVSELRAASGRIFYRANCRIGGNAVYLGIFDTPEDAARVYDAAVRKHRGETAYTNFPAE